MSKTSVTEIVREAEDNFLNGSVQISEYVEFDLHDTIEKIDAYLNSCHTSGPTDSLGREKPFFNIVTAAVNVWYRATDLDRKNIRILPDSTSNTALAFIATVHLQNWMKTSRFGTFLNDWGRALSRYGSAVVKFVERDGELMASVVPWNRMIVDPIDFDALPRIEKVYKTPAQLRRMPEYDQDVVKKLCDAQMSRQTLDGHNQDNQARFIEIYEVHGELPIALLEDDPDQAEDSKWETYRQQMHVVSFVQNEKGEYEDFTLFRGKEKKDPYMLTHLIKEDGRTLAIGAVEYLFDAQWMKNHTIKNMKDTLDLASKLIFQTSDANYVGRNVLSAIETGDILIHSLNQPLTQINNSKADIAAFQNFGQEWEMLAQTLTSTPDAIRGDTLPSGTPYSLAAYQGAQANSLFEIMTENKGLHLEDMMREYIIPHLKTKMDTTDEIVATLEDNEIEHVDQIYIKNTAIRHVNQELKNMVLNGEFPTPEDQESMTNNITTSLKEQLSNVLGNQRFFKPSEIPDQTWKELLEDFEMKVTVEVTNENTDKQAVMQTLSALFQTLASNPMVLQDANARQLFNQILVETGRISPLQLTTPAATNATQTSPDMGSVPPLAPTTAGAPMQ
jgi:hypothetical protein